MLYDCFAPNMQNACRICLQMLLSCGCYFSYRHLQTPPERFERSDPLGSSVFKTDSLNHSDTAACAAPEKEGFAVSLITFPPIRMWTTFLVLSFSVWLPALTNIIRARPGLSAPGRFERPYTAVKVLCLTAWRRGSKSSHNHILSSTLTYWLLSRLSISILTALLSKSVTFLTLASEGKDR